VRNIELPNLPVVSRHSVVVISTLDHIPIQVLNFAGESPKVPKVTKYDVDKEEEITKLFPDCCPGSRMAFIVSKIPRHYTVLLATEVIFC
tara:strand:- start:2227 stop:2496 length:270 start_codon:yes stop_codon:yes gene_type:complete